MGRPKARGKSPEATIEDLRSRFNKYAIYWMVPIVLCIVAVGLIGQYVDERLAKAMVFGLWPLVIVWWVLLGRAWWKLNKAVRASHKSEH